MRYGVALVAKIMLGGFILAAAGCQSGDRTGFLNLGGGKKEAAEPAQPKITESELRAFCPRVLLREGTASLNVFDKGGDGDATKLRHQASISDVTRTCNRSGGVLTMTVAVAGKVVPGPAFSGGQVTLPIRVVVVRGEEVLYSQLQQHPVAVSDPSVATQFVFSDPAVNFPEADDRSVMIYAGFDEGPAKKKATDE